jgi:EAL domain-containing protein (putative c-di-GMP-specific phosphodiesterase class I)
VEALVRWRHPERGLLVPASFLPVAIEAGLSRALTDTVLRQATAQLAGWHAAGFRVDVSVNLTQADVADPALGDRVVAACATAGVDPAWLVLEVTETTVGADDPHAVQRLAALRASGCRVSLDDFGTGQSSLSYLSRLPLDEVKLDRSFLSGLLSNPAAVTVVRGTTELVHGLGLRLVAEGVEEADVLTAITALGCDAVQGYHTGRPMAAGALTPLLQQAPRTDLVTAAGGTQVAVTA